MDEPLETERLRLRPFVADDLAALHALWAHPEVDRWVGPGRTLARSRRDLGRHLGHQRRHGHAFWAVEERAGGGLVGEVGLQLLEFRGPDVEIGWVIAHPSWGRGYATEAAAAWLRAGFGVLGLDRIVAVIRPDNAASRRVAERLGMRPDGRRRAYGAELDQFVIERSGPRAGA